MKYPVRRLCKVIQLHPSGYYAWLKEPISNRDKEELIRNDIKEEKSYCM